MKMKLEVVSIPVADVDRAKAFYVEQLGFNLDHDVYPGNGMRVVQLTPPGSACSIVMGTGMISHAELPPGAVKGLHLVVGDAAAARDVLVSRGVAVGTLDEYDQGIKSVSFSDPDGNSWLLQEIPWRSAEFDE